VAVTISVNGLAQPLNLNLTNSEKETGFGLVKVTLHGRLNGSTWPSSPQHCFTSTKQNRKYCSFVSWCG